MQSKRFGPASEVFVAMDLNLVVAVRMMFEPKRTSCDPPM